MPDEMLPVALDNPAGRLVTFIKDIARSSGNNPLARLAATFHLTTSLTDRSKLYQRLADVLELPDQVEEMIRSTPTMSPRYLNLMGEVREYFKNFGNLTENSGMPGQLVNPSPGMVTMLELCSDQLSLTAGDGSADRSAVDEIRDQINDLINDVRTSNTPERFSSFLLRELHILLNGVDQFLIRGVVPAENAFSAVIGDLYINREKFDASDEASSIWERFTQVLNRYPGVFSLGALTLQAVQTITQALPPGHH